MIFYAIGVVLAIASLATGSIGALILGLAAVAVGVLKERDDIF